MKKCVRLLCCAGLLSLLLPANAHAVMPQTQYGHAHATARATVRKAPKPPRRDQVHRSNLDGSITLIQLISTRRSQDERRQHRIAPPDSAAQVRASRDGAEREISTVLTARPVESLPPHWGATHLCI